MNNRAGANRVRVNAGKLRKEWKIDGLIRERSVGKLVKGNSHPGRRFTEKKENGKLGELFFI